METKAIPNTLVSSLYATIADKDFFAAFDTLLALDSWLRHGGHKPTNVKPQTYISIGNGGPVAYSLLSTPDGGAVFLRYEFAKSPTGNMEETFRFAWDG